MNKPAVMALFVISLFLFEKCLRVERRRVRLGYALLCGGSCGFMLLEQQDVGLLAAVFLGPYMLLRLAQRAGSEWRRWLAVAGPLAAVALLISLAPALRAYARHVADPSGPEHDARGHWEFITQWSFPPAEWPDIIAPGYTGWSSAHPQEPYWGVIGQSPEWEDQRAGFRNFRLDSLYIGVLPLFLAILGWLAAWRRIREGDEEAVVVFFWGLAALLAFALAMGKFSPVYRLFYNLPLVGNIRAPVKFMHNFQVMIGILSAFGLRLLLTPVDETRRQKIVRRFAYATAAAAALMLLAAFSPGYHERLMEWPRQQQALAALVRRAWIHAAAMAFLLSLGVFVLRSKRVSRFRPLVPCMLIAAVCFDSVYLTSRYFRPDDLSELRRGNVVIDYLRSNLDQARVFLFSTSGVYNRWLAYDFPWHGIEAFNVWQMPRMPFRYQRFLSAMGGNWKRTMEMASVRYALAPAGVWRQLSQSPELRDDFEPVMYYRFAARGGAIGVERIPAVSRETDQVLLRVYSSLPRLVLFEDWDYAAEEDALRIIAAPGFDHLRTAIVAGAGEAAGTPVGERGRGIEDFEITGTGAVARSDNGRRGLLLFTQFYGKEWSVAVDGRPAELLRCNDIAMGAMVPAGWREVRFDCPRDYSGAGSQLAGMLLALSGLLLAVLPCHRKKR